MGRMAQYIAILYPNQCIPSNGIPLCPGKNYEAFREPLEYLGIPPNSHGGKQGG